MSVLRSTQNGQRRHERRSSLRDLGRDRGSPVLNTKFKNNDINPLPNVINPLPNVIHPLPNLIHSVPNVLISLPDVIHSLPDVIISLPDVKHSLPDVMHSLPDTTISNKCEKCHKVLSSKGTLTRHMKTCSGINNKECQFCEEILFSIQYKDKHELICKEKGKSLPIIKNDNSITHHIDNTQNIKK